MLQPLARRDRRRANGVKRLLMYLPSDTPILPNQRANQARALQCSDERLEQSRRRSATGRAALFNTLISPNSVNLTFGMGAAIDTAKLQAQTQTSRATAILGTGGTLDESQGYMGSPVSLAQLIANAPEVVSVNPGGGSCEPRQQSYAPSAFVNPQPGMPQQAPAIVRTENGPLHFAGAPGTFPGAVQSHTDISPVPQLKVGQYYNIQNTGGLTGYAPPWSDAGVQETPGNIGAGDMGVASWLMDHPWLSLALAAGGVMALSRRSRR